MIDLVKYLIITEKSTRLMENNQYTFEVDVKLTKPQIKKLIDDLYQVKVVAVNTHRPPHKKKRFGSAQGNKPAYKRAIITLKSGQSLFSEEKIS